MDAVIIPERQAIGREDDLFVVVMDEGQWLHLPREGLLGGHIGRHLYIGVHSLLFRHKIHLGIAIIIAGTHRSYHRSQPGHRPAVRSLLKVRAGWASAQTVSQRADQRGLSE